MVQLDAVVADVNNLRVVGPIKSDDSRGWILREGGVPMSGGQLGGCYQWGGIGRRRAISGVLGMDVVVPIKSDDWW